MKIKTIVEDKMEARHDKGIYYTPEYIVENVVENTVGIKINKLTPDEIGKIRICDPACGSGSFLIGTFNYLIEYHKQFYLKSKDKKYKNDFYLTPDGEVKLSLKKKAEILINNIYGVDLDREATEVAIMSLYLKMLDEGFDKGQGELFLKSHILPDLTNNLKCGNSLIETDYFSETLDFNNEEWKKIKPFDWHKEFSDIFNQGGFDVVIGNPPYVDSETMTKLFLNERDYIYKKYDTAKGNWDLYIPFIERSFNIIKNNGRFSFITPNKWLSMNYGSTLRTYIKDYLVNLSDFSNVKVFKDAGIFPIVFVIEKNRQNNLDIKVFNEKLEFFQNTIIKNDYNHIDNFGLLFSKNIQVLNKILLMKNHLGDFCHISGAFTTSEAYELIPLLSEYNNDKESYLKFINTGTIERFHTLWGIENTTYLKSKYLNPIVKIEDFKKKFPKRFERFNKEKIIISGIRHFESIYDVNNEYLAGKSTSVLIDLDKKYDYYTISAILNSKLITYFLKECFSSSGMDGGINFSPDMISSLPLPEYSTISDEAKIKLKDLINSLFQSQMKYYNLKSDTDKNEVKKQIDLLENRINDIIFKLFSLSTEEVKIIENSDYFK